MSVVREVSLAQRIAEPNTILRATVGSTVHGLALEGSEDRDEMGICLEPREYVIGLQPFDQWVYRTQSEGVRSGPGDLDLTIYGLRKWARLALNGNPTILLLLFVPPTALVAYQPPGLALRELAPAFASKRAGKHFLGYMVAQKQRLLGERGQLRVKRPELEEAHGFDTKYAGHLLRLGYQGVEFLETGRISLPMPEPMRSEILDVRRGLVDFNDVLTRAGELEARLEDLLDTSPLPLEPDRDRVNEFLIAAYEGWWNGA